MYPIEHEGSLRYSPISNYNQFIPELIELHRKGRFPVDKLCKVYSIKDFDQAVKDMHDGKVVKPIIKWD